MNSLEGIIAANRNADRQQAVNRATNGVSKDTTDAAVKKAVRQTRINTQPKRSACGRIAR